MIINEIKKITSFKRYVPVHQGILMLNIWEGNMYASGDDYWLLLTHFEPKDENEKEDDD